MKHLTTLVFALLAFNFSFGQETERDIESEFSKKFEKDGVTYYEDEMKERSEKDDSQVFILVEQMPTYPGGDEALNKYIEENLVYPEEAFAQHVEGKVYVQYIIEVDGSIDSAKVVSGSNPLLDAEALRVVKSIAGYSPGMQRGKAVRVRYTIPVKFQI